MKLGDKMFTSLMLWRPLYRLVPASSSLKHLWVFMKLLLTELDYNVWKQFDKLGCDRIYEDKSVCSGRDHGIRGLGTEVVRRSELLAAQLGCTHTYACVTGPATDMGAVLNSIVQYS